MRLNFIFYWARRARGSLFLALFIVQGKGCAWVFFLLGQDGQGKPFINFVHC